MKFNIWDIVTTSAYDTKTAKNGYFYNKDGPSNMNTSGDDDIYIECKPTGSEGSELTKEPKSSFNFNFDKYGWIIGALIGAIILYILVMVFNAAFSKIFHKTINADTGS